MSYQRPAFLIAEHWMRQILKRGTQGDMVAELQQLLKQRGFNPGAVDGVFGPATEAALMAFQSAHQLLADGIAGPMTYAALGIVEAPHTIDVTAQVSIDVVSRMFPFTRIDTIKQNLPLILSGLRRFSLTEKPMVLMALATIRAETETFEPVDEHVSRFNTSPGGQPFDLYDHRRDIGNMGPPDGERFRGRGYVQLTGRANYTDLSRLLSLRSELVEHPDRANDPALAGLILAAFLGRRRTTIKRALLDGELAWARRMVNGGRHGLDRFRDAYLRGDRLIIDPVWQGSSDAASSGERFHPA